MGKMGAGKSSLMDAISFALYGTFPSLAARKVSLEETIMNKPTKQEQSTITLEFDYNGKEYSVERIVKRKGINEASLKENGKTIAGPQTTQVTKKIEEILEANYDLFSRAIYSEQNQVDFFLKLNPSQRKEKFDELLGLDKYEKVRTNSVTLKNRLKKITEDRKKFLEEQKTKTNGKELEEYETKTTEKQKQISETKNELAQTEKEHHEKETELKQLESSEKEYRFLKELEIKTKAKKETLSDEIKKIREKLKTKEDSGKKLEEYRNSKKETVYGIESTEKMLKDNEKVANNIREELAVYRNQLETSEESSKNTKKLDVECPICKRPLSKHDKDNLQKELREEAEKLEKQIKELEKTVKEHEKETKKEEEKIIALKEKLEGLDDKIREHEKAFELEKEANAKEKQLQELEKEAEKLEKNVQENKFEEKELKEKREAFYKIREKNTRLKIEIKNSEELLREYEEAIKRIKKAQEQIKELEIQVKENEKTVEKLAIFTSALQSTQADLRHTMIETINEAMEEIWPRIYTYGDYSKVKIIVEEGSYEIMVKNRNNEWVRVEGILSGGERSAVALTLRIAVSLVLTQNLGWIILDEPTHNLDANSINVLSEVMRMHLPELIEQIFLITHDKELENAASGKLYVLEREKEKDGPTKILG